jgi:pyruvate/2-oxoglutarate dehydrogenase complex dihydrolipoamide dehydrogenase (E3) component
MATRETLLVPTDEHDQKLVENAHPPGWKNPTPQGRYNLVVLGAGTAGLVSAAGAAALGARVALIERHLMGGDCLNYGCVPSKALIRAARAAQAMRDATRFGIRSADPDVDFSRVMQRVREARAQISVHDSAQRFSSLGADVFLGNARFIGDHAIDVDGVRLDFSKAIIAAGARPGHPDIPGLKEAGFLTNETVFNLTERPRRLVVIGGGPIGCELAQSFRRLGSEVSIIGRQAQLLPKEDSDASAILTARLRKEGISLYLGADISKVFPTINGKCVVFNLGREEKEITCDDILVAVGRVPNIEGLTLHLAGVEHSPLGVVVDDRLRTSNRDIYAAGDICSRFKFTHAAEAMARIALQNALFFGRKKASALVIPWCTYTDPEIAHVGMNQAEAKSKGVATESFTLGLDDNDRAITDGEVEGFMRILTNRKNGRIIGATLASSHAGESIGEVVLAIKQRLKLNDLGGVIHPYPTQAEIIKRVGDSSMKSRLKPWMKTILVKMFAMRR